MTKFHKIDSEGALLVRRAEVEVVLKVSIDPEQVDPAEIHEDLVEFLNDFNDGERVLGYYIESRVGGNEVAEDSSNMSGGDDGGED